jgi:hypothetical protein
LQPSYAAVARKAAPIETWIPDRVRNDGNIVILMKIRIDRDIDSSATL